MQPLKQLISIVVPFYNESSGVNYFYEAISAVINPISSFDFEVICIDDGSRDDTLQKLIYIATQDKRFRVLEFSRNFGKEAALTAGIDASLGHAVIPIDSDLQDPPELIPVLIEEWKKGAEVVLAKRTDRNTDFFLKRKSAEWFYRLHNRLSDLEIPENVGDFRLMDRNVINALKNLPERQRFMKGLFAWVGFKTTTVNYSRNKRIAGNTKFSGWKLWNFALEGITSFSTAPLKLMTYTGITLTLLTFLYAITIITRTLIFGVDVPGYASLLVAILFLGGLQLIGIGILGEYIGRIYMESKQRPTYVVRKQYSQTENL